MSLLDRLCHDAHIITTTGDSYRLRHRSTGGGDAQETIDAYDRPFARRRHAQELDTARNQLQWIPRSIDHDRTKLAEAVRLEARASEAYRDAYSLSKQRPELLAEQSIVQHHLREDIRARADELAAGAPDYLVRRLGPVPTTAAEHTAWKAAAGQVAQHRHAYEWDAPTLLEPEPRGYVEVDAYVASHRAAREAVTGWDRTLGRAHEIEPPHRELGIELSL